MKLNRHYRRRILAGAGLLAVGGGAWWQFGRAKVVQTSEVRMTLSQFQPRNIQVPVGTEVTWTNTDPQSHTITSASDNWDVDMLVQGGVESSQSTSYTFEDRGIYEVYCKIHGESDLSGMSMKVGVGTGIDEPLGGWF